MASLDKVLDEAMDLPLEQQEMPIQILQRLRCTYNQR
jgi:hypothetical protein